MFKRNDGKINIFMLIGLLLIVAALLLVGYNLYDEKRAGSTADEALNALKSEQLEAPDIELPTNASGEYNLELVDEDTEIPDYILNPDMDLPLANVEGQEYVGTIDMPSIDRKLPVIAAWDYPKMKIAPCVYTGTPYKNDFILVAHNYITHFGPIRNMKTGDKLSFTDMDGNVFNYKVIEKEVLEPSQVEYLKGGNWDLTLVTCTLGGKTRVTVRCERD